MRRGLNLPAYGKSDDRVASNGIDLQGQRRSISLRFLTPADQFYAYRAKDEAIISNPSKCLLSYLNKTLRTTYMISLFLIILTATFALPRA